MQVEKWEIHSSIPSFSNLSDAPKSHAVSPCRIIQSFHNPDLMRLYIVGGGGCLVKHFGQYDESRVTILDDICATAKGYEYLAFASLRRKE